jgi:hypothetical protein
MAIDTDTAERRVEKALMIRQKKHTAGFRNVLAAIEANIEA